ncbi:excinuclease ABC subunit A [Thermodesulfobacterium sp. TA1]|uniref:excinuclease ABC subunit UvrA n=1 Tax=Thermodesulfobacterium sp. TA1 TaxID=2234087 RepID=UPI001231AB9A|nr:excinuclease ABC subunit UvrA [Thermodesulfobacterium sp. TA1]QER41533.1 excinuclease ABC subunit A [Thermodesulfobacterium sp. TA1]
MKSQERFIELLEVSQNNLKGFDLRLPLYRLIAVTGVSGSGKSSLVFDTLFAEGQRRYIETFSSYVRQFFEKLPRPKVKAILNIPPALAFPQGNYIKTSRSTVATLTEISHFTKMLYYYSGVPFCPNCKEYLLPKTPQAIAKEIIERFYQVPIYLTAPQKTQTNFEYLKDGLLSAGFSRVFLDGKVCEIDELEEAPEEIDVIVHRLKPTEKDLPDLSSSVEMAFKLAPWIKVRSVYGEEIEYTQEEACPKCGFKVPEKSPNLFSFNSSLGACPQCKGFGNLLVLDFDALVKHPEKPVTKGAIPILDFPFLFEVKLDLIEFLRSQSINLNLPFKSLPEEVKQKIFWGEGEWYGLKELIDWLESKRYKPHIRILLSKLRREVVCPVCKGTRFNPQALTFRVNGLTIGDFYGLEVKEAVNFIKNFLGQNLQPAEERLAKEILRRLSYLEEVGLSYLSLNRASKTLSGGETSRCLLTRALSSNLVETLYLIDEPTTGLHPKDTQKVLFLLESLVSKKNTVVVVEHDPEIITQADLLIDLGPEGGQQGGHLLFFGPPKEIFARQTPTSEALKEITQRRKPPLNDFNPSGFIRFYGAKKHNLKGFSFSIPLRTIICIVGVSGSGKSTLLEEIIYQGLLDIKNQSSLKTCEKIEGANHIDQVLYLTQEPLARSPRSIVATYLDIMIYLRKLLASTNTAKRLGYPETFFSFNSEYAQCPACKGLGFEVIEMQFLSDLTIPCEVCKGTRFKEEVLEVRWRGKNIAEMLDLTVDQALEFFGGHEPLKKTLTVLKNLGIGYLKLGQPLSTLSGGEAQRLKIAELLSKIKGEKCLVLLDEPTVGLHLKDVKNLISSLEYLKSLGHTVVVVEHNPELILNSDWVLELGPGGGEEGGELLFQGTIAEFLQNRKVQTPTSIYLKDYLQGLNLKEKAENPKTYHYEEDLIKLRGIRHHNLKNIDLDLPRKQFIVITGVSGSGKSTVAFDVVFAEGQRRFLETLPTYLKQFFKLHEEIDYDLISGIPPTVALEQRSGELSPKSTVGTLTEILPYLRLLYAKVSKAFCPRCGRELKPRNPEELFNLALVFLKQENPDKITLLAPLVKHRKGVYKTLFEKLLASLYHKVRINGEFYQIPPIPMLSRFKEYTIEVVLAQDIDWRGDWLEKTFYQGLEIGKGEILIKTDKKEVLFSQKRTCPSCMISLPEPDPLLFAFNSKVGACSTCGGLGRVEGQTCPNCQGSRYRKEVFFYKINGLSLPEVANLSLYELKDFLQRLQFEGIEKKIAEELISEALSRLEYLIDLGVGYLTLGRSADTLSSGEAKRVRISAEIGNNLTGVAYILDEPTIGLHPKDTQKLIRVLKKLRDKGNTVIVVEHDEETILASDFVVDLGPEGGKRGGKVTFAGRSSEFLNASSPTAEAIKDQNRKTLKSLRRKPVEFLTVKGASLRNLKNLTVSFPLNALTVVVGVSGSGKSSLVVDCLYENLKNLLEKEKKKLFGVKVIENWEKIKRVYLVDPQPIGNTPKSTPATYIGVFTDIRKAFANTLLAKQRGYKEGRFSFNTKEGQCPYCNGQGYEKIEIKFLPAVYQKCEYCGGKRYNPETLEILLKGKNIAEVLEMDFAEAVEFFNHYPSIHHKLKTLCDIGLDYLTLGQPSPTLSGGEAQRIKLAKEFIKSSHPGNLYLLDEPTTGLHIKDVEKLAKLLQGLIEKGHTVIVIEHNLELIKWADWIIELGPEGGEKGGEILFQGPIEDFLKADTITAKVLKNYLNLT